MKKNIHFILLFGIAINLIACKGKAPEAETVVSDTIPVKLQPISEELAAASIHASGQFTTEDETFLAFKTGGVVQKIFVVEGEAVRKGQVIATLVITEIEAMVEQAKIALEKAERDNKRAENLYKDSVATLEQVQNSRTALSFAQEQFTAAKFNRQYAEIRATQDGFILRKLANDGQIVGPGTPVVQLNGAGNGKWVLKVNVSESDWSRIQKGCSATIATHAGQTSTAMVKTKSEGIDPITGTLWVTLETTGRPLSHLATGLFGSADIMPKEQTKGWKIPFDALLEGNGNSGYVFVTPDGKSAMKAAVNIGSIQENSVWVTSGLEGYDAIIVSGSAYLKEKTPIRIIQ